MVKSGTDVDDVKIGSRSDRKSKDMLGRPDMPVLMNYIHRRVCSLPIDFLGSWTYYIVRMYTIY